MLKGLKAKLKDQRGLTLIELLAVIVILGIIAGIAVPSVNNVISKARDKATVQEGIQIINAAKMYVANNNDTVTSTTILSKGDLTPYLDHVKASTFSVIVTVSSGNVTYSLTGGHPAIPIANTEAKAETANEQQLVDAAK